MREIKFRAWDKNQKRWLDDVYIRLDGWASSMLSDDGGKNGLWEHDAGNHDDIVLIQYTGLKDKNGKDIYEGDIIQTVAEDGTKLSKFQIDWRDGAFRKLRDDGNIYFAESCGVKHTEVIGNIHENPELLEGK